MKKKIGYIILIVSIILILIGIIYLFYVPKEKKYKISFDSNGGTYIEPVYVKEGSILLKPKTPNKDKNIFLGWYLESGEKYDFYSKVFNDIKLVAKWGSLE